MAGSAHGGRGHHRRRGWACRAGGSRRGGRRRTVASSCSTRRAGGQPRRPGLVVAGRAVPGEHARNSATSASRTRRSSPWPTGWDRRVRPARGSLAARMGAGATSISRPARNASWLRAQGIKLFPIVQWAERGGIRSAATATPCRVSTSPGVPDPGVLTPFVRRVTEHVRAGRVQLRFRHRVTELVREGNAVTGVAGEVLEPTAVGPRRTVVPGGGRRVRARLRGGDRHVRRHRRQPRPGTPQLAGRPGCRAGRDALRGAGFHRRPDAGGDRTRGWSGDQPRPDVALPRGRGQPLTGLERDTASASCPGRARCGWTPSGIGCPRRCSPGSTRSGRCGTSWPPGGRTPGSLLEPAHHRPGVRALRAPSRTPTSRRSRSSCC